jgi:uncharacterized membrane protein YdjX (TVP38/TMEM64 family)
VPRRTLILLAVLAAAAVGLFVWASDWLTLEWLKDNRNVLVAYCRQNMMFAAMTYVAFFSLWAALCLPGVGPLAMAGGMVFGHWMGTGLATMSAVAGATVAFLVARHLLREWAHARFAGMFAVIDRGVARDGAFYLFTLRLIIVVPFFLVNPIMGLTAMPLRTFAAASTLGMIANSFMWVNAGTMLNRIDRVEDVLSGPVVLSFALIGILPLLLKWLFFRGK